MGAPSGKSAREYRHDRPRGKGQGKGQVRRQDSGSRSSGCFALGLLLALAGGLELAAGGQTVVPPSSTHRRRDMPGREPLGEARYGRIRGTIRSEQRSVGYKGKRKFLYRLATSPN